MPIVSNTLKRECVCFVILDDVPQAERVKDLVDALWIRVYLDIRKTLLQHAPAILNSTGAYERILLMYVELRMIDPEVIPSVFAQMRSA